MAVRIRFARIGKKHSPFYRIVAMDSRAKRDGESLEILGTYDPVKGQIVQYHEDKINAWIAKGAIVTDSVKKVQKLYKKTQKTAAAA